MYSIVYRAIAAIEYQEAIEWYAEKSKVAAEKFIKAINEKLDNICRDPRQYKNLYRNYYEISVRKYPYCIVYFIEDALQEVIVVAVYHHKRHPKKNTGRKFT